MKAQLSTSQFTNEVRETLSAVYTHTRSKIISTARHGGLVDGGSTARKTSGAALRIRPTT